MKIKLLWISNYFPLNNEHGSAGSNILWYNQNRLENDDSFENRLITFRMENEESYASPVKESTIVDIKKRVFKLMYRGLFDFPKYINPIESSAGHLSRYRRKVIGRILKQFKNDHWSPEIVVLDWTEMILLSKYIKRIFGNAKIVGFVHDVCFQKVGRANASEMRAIRKYFGTIKENRLKQLELKSYHICDSVIVINNKDAKLLLAEGIHQAKIRTMLPYYKNYSSCKPIYSRKILFWGSMGRIENHQACLWFIDNVLENLIRKTSDLIFVVAGNNPRPELISLQSRNIHVTGMVLDPQSIFEDALCFVAPLSLGGGIKIKILEAFSSGLPVLTNSIGIEGIDATAGRDYLHCEIPSEYEETIVRLLDDPKLAKTIGLNGRRFVNTWFSPDQEYMKLKKYFLSEL